MEEENLNRARVEEIQRKITEVRSKIVEASDRFEKRNRVTTTTIILMLSVAGFYDLLQFGLDWIPVLGWILSSFVGIYAWLTFYVWTSIKGWGFTDTVKKWGVYGLQVLGVLPLLNFGPEITMGVFLTLLIVKSDDFIYNQTKGQVDVENIKQGLQFFNLLRDVEA